MFGVTELLIIGGILVLLFGATRLPAVGEGLGKMIRNFKRDVTKPPKKVEGPGEESAPPAAKQSADSDGKSG